MHLQSGVDTGVKAASTAPSAASFISHGKWVQAEVQLKRKVKGLKTQQPMPPRPPMPNGTMPDCESAEFDECFRLCSPCIDGEENADGGSCEVCEACNEFIPCLFMIPGLLGPYGPPPMCYGYYGYYGYYGDYYDYGYYSDGSTDYGYSMTFISQGRRVKQLKTAAQLQQKVKGLKTEQPMPPMPPMPNGTMPDCNSAEFDECFRRCSPCLDGDLDADGGPCETCEACNEFIPCLYEMPGLLGPYGPPPMCYGYSMTFISQGMGYGDYGSYYDYGYYSDPSMGYGDYGSYYDYGYYGYYGDYSDPSVDYGYSMTFISQGRRVKQ